MANPTDLTPIKPARLAEKGLVSVGASVTGANTIALASAPGLAPRMSLLLSSAGLTAPVLATPTYLNTGGTLASGSTYAYRISALSAYGETLAGAEASVAIPPLLAIPVITAVTPANTGGVLAAGLAIAYRVSAVNALGETIASAEVANTTPAPLPAPAVPNLNHANASGHTQPNGLRPATQYAYRFTAINALGETLASTPVTITTPGIGYTAATSTAITATGSQTFTLTATTGVLTNISNGDYLNVDTGVGVLEAVQLTAWDSATGIGTATFTRTHNAGVVVTNACYSNSVYCAPVTGATGYRVYGRTSGAEGYLATYADANSGYFDGNQSPPPPTPVPPLPMPPTAGAVPPVVNTTATTTNSAAITWLATPGADSYSVYGRTAGNEQRLAAGITALTWTDDGRTNPAGALPPGPSGSGNTYSVPLSWGAVAGATGGYNIYGRTPGAEQLLAHVPAGTTAWPDGGASPQPVGLPASDTSMLPPEVQIVATSFVPPSAGAVNVVVPLVGTPDSSRTLARYEITAPDGPRLAGFLGDDLPTVASAVYDPTTDLFATPRAAVQDGITGRHLQEVALGLLNLAGGFDRLRGVNGALLIVDGCTPAQPVLHRLNVQAADTSYPATPQTLAQSYPHGAIVPGPGQRYVDLDVTLVNPAGGAALAQLQPLLWNARQGLWVAQATQAITLQSGTTTLQGFRLDTRGRAVFIAVAQLSANCIVVIDAVLS